MQYDNLSDVYDLFNDDFDYSAYLENVFKKFPLAKEGLVLDCGCGTGVLMEILEGRGYECTGIDASENMLFKAEERLSKNGKEAHLICQELEEIDMYGAYHIVFCTLDTVNHILSKRGLQSFFNRLYNFTEPGGHFVFDFKTKCAFESSVSPIISENGDDTLILQGQFDGKYAYYDFTLFEKVKNGLYEKIEDTVEERYYPPEELKDMLLKAGFSFTGRIARKDRIIFCAEKKE